LLQLIVDLSSYGIDNRLKLLKDLLLHERAEVARHDLLDLLVRVVIWSRPVSTYAVGLETTNIMVWVAVGPDSCTPSLMAMNWALVETLLRPMVETHPSLVTFSPHQCLSRLIWDQSLWDQSSMLIKAYMGPGSSGHKWSRRLLSRSSGTRDFLFPRHDE
jgi:hypothetical protein